MVWGSVKDAIKEKKRVDFEDIDADTLRHCAISHVPGVPSVVFGHFPSPLRRFPFKVHGRTWGSSSFYLGLFVWFQGRAVHPHNLGRRGGTNPMAHVVLLSPSDSRFLHTSAPGWDGASAGSGALRLTHEMAHVTFWSGQRWARRPEWERLLLRADSRAFPEREGGEARGGGFLIRQERPEA